MKKLIPLLLLLAGTAWGQQTIHSSPPCSVKWGQKNTIGTATNAWSVNEVHITPRPDTTTIYLHYADGGCDTIKAAPSRNKSKYRSEVSGLYSVALLAAQTQREAITWADLEAYLADTTEMDSILVGCEYVPIGPNIKGLKRIDKYQYIKRAKTLTGPMAWRMGRK